jgi:hypothetical protein
MPDKEYLHLMVNSGNRVTLNEGGLTEFEAKSKIEKEFGDFCDKEGKYKGYEGDPFKIRVEREKDG